MITEEEIEEKMDDIVAHYHNPQFHGMTFEQGVRAAIEWVLGDEDYPFDDN